MEDISWLTQIVKHAGLPMAIMVFYIWRDWKREAGMALIINNLTAQLVAITKDATQAITESNMSNSQLAESIDKLSNKIDGIN